jgi:hypothetical protein
MTSIATQSTSSLVSTVKSSTEQSASSNETGKSAEPLINVTNAVPPANHSATVASESKNTTLTTPLATHLTNNFSKNINSSNETTISIDNSSTTLTTHKTSKSSWFSKITFYFFKIHQQHQSLLYAQQ